MRPCLVCGKPSKATRCRGCESTHQQQRNARRTHYHGDWQRISKARREAWVVEHGWVCPGVGRPPHPTTRLTLDHTLDIVCCLPCNVRAGAMFTQDR